MLDDTHDPSLGSWVESANDPATDFPIQNLPLGVFCRDDARGEPRAGIAIVDRILDLELALAAGHLPGTAGEAARGCTGGTLGGLMALGAPHRAALRRRVSELLRAGSPPVEELL